MKQTFGYWVTGYLGVCQKKYTERKLNDCIPQYKKLHEMNVVKKQMINQKIPLT